MGGGGSKNIPDILVNTPHPTNIPDIPKVPDIPKYDDKCYEWIQSIINNPLKTQSSLCWIVTEKGIYPKNECLQTCKDDPSCFGIFSSENGAVTYSNVRTFGNFETINMDFDSEGSVINDNPMTDYEVPCVNRIPRVYATLT